MSNDIEDLLRDGMERFTADLRAPAGLARLVARRRRRRLAARSAAAATALTAGAALALSLTGVLGTGTAVSGRNAGAMRTAAFTLTSHADGTDTLTLRLTMRQVLDPAELQRALARDGIPALVKAGVYCSSDPAAPDPNSIGVLTPTGLRASGLLESVPPPGFQGLPGAEPPLRTGGTNPGGLGRIVGDTSMVINPAAMPAGTELFFDYINGQELVPGLIYTSSYTCSAGQPPGVP